MDDIKAIRNALAGVNFYKKGGFSYAIDEWNKAVNPLRIARLLDALEAAQRDAERWRWLANNGVLGFQGAPSYRAVISFEQVNGDSNTLAACVDSAISAAGSNQTQAVNPAMR